MTEASVSLKPDDIHRICETLLCAAGVDTRQRDSVARNILWNELEGRHNFGLERLPTYLKRLVAGGLNPSPVLQKDVISASVARVDGDNGFGQYVGEEAMSTAMELAETTGLGACSAMRSNFYGSGAYFVARACEQNMAAIAVSNSYPKVTAFGGRHAVLGTNPFAFGAPGPQGIPILIDFSTGSLAGSTVRDYDNAGRPLPEGVAIFPDGAWARNPKTIGDAALTPFGGAKGFGVALLVEILAGVLSGAGISHGVGSLYSEFEKATNSGHFFVAIDITRWMSMAEFNERMLVLAQALANSAGSGEVRLPGAERKQKARRLKEGIPVSLQSLHAMNDFAKNMKWPQFEFGKTTAPDQ